ncbi:MAG: membrane protein insertion efficiency factor YidD [Bacteroidales bacterium]|nr:membrane protein insertion efficiency factor YidD [Bacteroidales bacterium]
MKAWISTFVLMFSSTIFALAQTTGDVELLRNADFNKYSSQHKVSYGFYENPSKVALYNPVYHILSGSMWVYQKYISPQISRNCPYHPSCSAYSRQLIGSFGIVKGVVFSSDRLMRCNRVALEGVPRSAFDPNDGKIHETTDRYSLR